MSGKVILLTSDHPWARGLAHAARALAHAMVESGIFLNGVIVETAPQPKCWKQVLHDFMGEDLYLSLVSRKWPVETRPANSEHYADCEGLSAGDSKCSVRH
jgi:hypothetical protein